MVIVHQGWLWMAWIVFLIALGLKLWRFTTPVRKHLLGRSPQMDRFRQTLERSWGQR
jgi:hypothetical protein